MWRLWTRRCSMSQWSKFAFMCAGATMLDLTIRQFFLSVRVIGRWDKVHTKGSHFCAEVLTAPCGICQESGTWLLRRTCLQSCYGHCLQRWRRSICWWRVLILVIGQMYSVSRKRWRRATSRAIRLPGVLKIKGFEYKDQFAVEIFECQLHCSSEVAGLTRVACCVELLESEWLIGNFLKEISSFRWGCFLASDRIYVVTFTWTGWFPVRSLKLHPVQFHPSTTYRETRWAVLSEILQNYDYVYILYTAHPCPKWQTI